MGSGASRQALLQRSDSRLDALLAEARTHPKDERLSKFDLEKAPPGMRVELTRPAMDRASPYAVQSWCQDATASLNETDVPVNEGAASDIADEKGRRDKEEEEEDGYSTDDFEDDEVSEWKKGASIGAGSYGTVRTVCELFLIVLQFPYRLLAGVSYS